MENSLWKFLMRVSFRSKSEEIDNEDVRYYHTKRCIEAGEEYDPELKWLESESESGAEVNDDRSSGSSSGVQGCSSGKYTVMLGVVAASQCQPVSRWMNRNEA